MGSDTAVHNNAQVHALHLSTYPQGYTTPHETNAPAHPRRHGEPDGHELPRWTRLAHERGATRIIKPPKRSGADFADCKSWSEGKDCDAILTQVMAARSALNQAALQVIGHSMRSCLKEGAKERDDIVEEAIALFMKYSGGSA